MGFGSPMFDMRFFVIGSCRVHGPLSDAKGYSRGPGGYVHSTKEAIQHIEYIRQQRDIPDRLKQLVLGRDISPWSPKHQSALAAADVTVVEVCTGKINEYDKTYFQSNYMLRFKTKVPEGVVTYQQDDLAEDIARLKSAVSSLVVVQHIELPGIPERSAFAAELRQACADHDVPVFIPTGKTIDPYHYDPKALPEVRSEMLRFIREC